MGLFRNKKFTRRLSIIFAGTLLFTTILHGASLTKKIDATFRDIKVYYNNQQKTMEQEPFIYNGSVYLPVRAVSELVDKNVHWDSAKNGVYVTDKGTSSSTVVQQLQSEIVSKNFEIAKINAEKSVLESKIKELEGDGKGSGASGDLKNTLRYLEDDFGSEYGIYWDFVLSQSGSRINVEVSFDSREDGRRWDKLTKKQQEDFFKNISKEIRYDHRDATINGKIVDSRTDKTIASFSYSKSNSFFYTPEGSYSFYDLEKELVTGYKSIDKDKKISINDIVIDGDEDHIVFTVTVNLSNRSLRDDWEDLTKHNINIIKELMWDIEDEIKRDYRYAIIDGYIEDYANRNETIARYEKGSLTIPR